MKGRLLKLLPVLLLLLLVVPTVLAAVRVDSDGQVPFYARTARGDSINDGETAVIIFYRPPSCIPAEFNLLDFFDFPSAAGPGAFGCNPPTTDSIEFWRNGPDVDFAPVSAKIRGLGAVPMWFISLSEIEAAIADDMLTIGELEALPSLRKGSASYYREILRPSGSPSQRPNGIHVTARGEFEDDSRFLVRVSIVGDRMNQVRIRFMP
jgi:hypothetical protein